MDLQFISAPIRTNKGLNLSHSLKSSVKLIVLYTKHVSSCCPTTYIEIIFSVNRDIVLSLYVETSGFHTS
jgi:hypothetical protein